MSTAEALIDLSKLSTKTLTQVIGNKFGFNLRARLALVGLAGRILRARRAVKDTDTDDERLEAQIKVELAQLDFDDVAESLHESGHQLILYPEDTPLWARYLSEHSRWKYRDLIERSE